MIRIIALLVFLCLKTGTNGYTQQLPILQSNTVRLDIRDGNELRKGRWNIDLKAKPDVFSSFVVRKYKWVTFISDRDSLRFKVKAGRKYPFIVLLNGRDTAYTQIDGIKAVPNARFSKRYIHSHEGRSFAEIPPVYELFSIISALTETGRTDNGLITQNTPYYKDLLAWFGKYKDERIVQAIDSVLSDDLMGYVPLKMDTYAFEMSSAGKITQSVIYDRISMGQFNTLKRYSRDLQTFSDRSNFQEFYQKHNAFYASQIACYKDTIGLEEMHQWLETNFPSTKYDSFKVIFSPLAGTIQSAAWFENNGFKEAQAHVNYPYTGQDDQERVSPKSRMTRRGNIVFTELNHSFVNPEGEKPQYRAAIARAFSDLNSWTQKGKPAAQYYNNPNACFNEYMNWALVSLRYSDNVPDQELEVLIEEVEKKQTEVRGFKKFSAFNQYLLKIYRERASGQTVADLYPMILAWFENNK
jgi:hypothetical protein